MGLLSFTEFVYSGDRDCTTRKIWKSARGEGGVNGGH